MTAPAWFAPLSRVMIALIFVLSGLNKVTNSAGTAAYMDQAGVPGILALPAGLFELVAGLALIAGFQTRITALVLAGFCLVAGALFHNNFADQVQMVMFLKNIAIAGGLLSLTVHGPGSMSVDKSA